VARRRLLALAVVAGVAAPGLAVAMTSSRAGTSRTTPTLAVTGLGGGPKPAFVPGRPRPLGDPRTASRWAPVLRPVAVLPAPAQGAPVASLATRTPEGTTNPVLVIGTTWRHGQGWARVRLPILPNNSTGWVPRSALGGYHFVSTHLVVDLEHLQTTLWRDGRRVFRAPVGIGQPQWPTPRGEFYVRNELSHYGGPFYGPVAFGTSARSSVLTDWPDGGFVGIHGTDVPGLIPGRISHGCVRLRNPDILRLARLMPIGTPLTIR
jgi:L,D-transpeptidase catalytic domain